MYSMIRMFDRLIHLVTLGALLGLPRLSLAAPHETMIARGDWRPAPRGGGIDCDTRHTVFTVYCETWPLKP